MKRVIISFILCLSFVLCSGFSSGTGTLAAIYIVDQNEMQSMTLTDVNDYLSSLNVTVQSYDIPLYLTSIAGVYDPLKYCDQIGNTWTLQYLPYVDTFDTSVGIASGFRNLEEMQVDMTGFYTVLILRSNYYGSGDTYPIFGLLRVTPDNPVYMVGKYLVSASPFTVYGQRIKRLGTGNNNYILDNLNINLPPQTIYDIDTSSVVSDISSDALYYYDLSTYPMNNNVTNAVVFTDLKIFSAINNSDTLGFSRGSFNIANVRNYTNLNVMTENGTIYVEPEEEEEEEEYISLGEYYNYVGIEGFFSSYTDTSISNHLSFSYNDYMRLHPNEFTLRLRYDLDVTLDTGVQNDSSNLPTTFGYSHDIPLVNIFGYRNQNSADSFMDLIKFTDLVTLSDQHAHGVQNFNEFLRSFWAIESGSSTSYYNDGSVVRSYGGSSLSGGSHSFGRYELGQGMKIKSIKIICRAKMIYTFEEPETSSGYCIYHYDFFTGDNTQDGNAAATNFNPMENPPSQYGDGKINTGGNGGNSYGNNNAFGGSASGGNVTINGLGNQPVYKLDEVQLQGIADMLNTLTGTLQASQDSNGFWQVMKGCYDYIPDRIWTWILVTVGAVCAGAIARWYLTSKR